MTQIPLSLGHLITEKKAIWPLTSMRVGGVARWLATPATVSGFCAVLSWIQQNRLPYVILGGGTNVVFSDKGYDGVVICTQALREHRIQGDQVVVTAGEPLAGLAMKLNRLGLSGMEWACGIPGTVGGALVMNAGTRDGDMASVVQSVRAWTASGMQEWPIELLKLGYRTSALRTGELEGIVLEVSLKLHHEDPVHCLERERAILETRRRTQPHGASCGCIFKNPETGPTAGVLLDRAGCKGLREGAAVVSDAHANFIINEGQNNASEVLKLICQMKLRVKESVSVELVPEVVILE